MPSTKHSIYIGTILLELKRWASPKEPTYRVSEWTDRFREAGFDGMELWEYHATAQPADEVAAIQQSGFPVSVYNAYCGFEDDAAQGRQTAAEMIARLKSPQAKFNVGREAARWDEYQRNLRIWIDQLGPNCTPLCECHGGTVIETPEAAARFFEELDRDRWGIMVHAFSIPPDALRSWLQAFGPRLAHVHVQAQHDGRNARLSANVDANQEVLRILREEGFTGSFTLEFTEGTRAPDESMEGLWQAALADLAFLRDCLG